MPHCVCFFYSGTHILGLLLNSSGFDRKFLTPLAFVDIQDLATVPCIPHSLEATLELFVTMQSQRHSNSAFTVTMGTK